MLRYVASFLNIGICIAVYIYKILRYDLTDWKSLSDIIYLYAICNRNAIIKERMVVIREKEEIYEKVIVVCISIYTDMRFVKWLCYETWREFTRCAIYRSGRK